MNVEIISKAVFIIVNVILFCLWLHWKFIKMFSFDEFDLIERNILIKGSFGNTIQCSNVVVRIKKFGTQETASLQLAF